ncbi:MAG: PEGA domain-containing protein [Gammaproteobacteria bacterium]|nr:MAG: PEGA domain-containing protein [Gammaproteobacteria bacterium]
MLFFLTDYLSELYMHKEITTATIILALTLLSGCEDKEKSIIRIITNPRGAEIYINGEEKGNSPSEIGQTFAIKLSSGDYTLEAKNATEDKIKEWYATKTIHVHKNTLQTVELRLESRFSKQFLAKIKEKYNSKVIEPEMTTIPKGDFEMGCDNNKFSFCKYDRAIHPVSVQSFSMSKYEVTIQEWSACFLDGGCDYYPYRKNWQQAMNPVTGIDWNDVQQYIKWLNEKTGKKYNLPSEAQWEYAARAGTKTKFSWGNKIGRNNAYCKKCGVMWNNDSQVINVGSFQPNKWGLFDMLGNAREWTLDCWNDFYIEAPTDGSAWTSGDCSLNTVRGGSPNSETVEVYSSFREPGKKDGWNSDIGFRLSITE